MATPAQVANRAQPIRPERHYPARVTATGPPVRVALEPGGATVTAIVVNAVALAVDQRVLVLVTQHGNYVIGRI